jgi:F0F1-type ATP synthase epsilon subunit
MAVRAVQNLQTDEAIDDAKVKRTLASFCGFAVNGYMMWIFKATEGVSSESQLFFYLLAFVMLVVTVRERDASYFFTAFALFYIPYIVLAAGLSAYALAALAVGAVVIGFQRGVTMKNLTEGASGLAGALSQSNLRRKILKLSQSDIEPELLLDEDLGEFREIEGELIKAKKVHHSAKPAMKNLLNKSITQVEELQAKHATVLARSAGLTGFLKTIDRQKIDTEIESLKQQLATAGDDVVKAQLESTIKMKEERNLKLNDLETSLNRVKMQKLQMREMFNSLMDHLNTLKFTDVMTMEASSDSMVKEVENLRSGLDDLEKGLIEAEKLRR